jgi:glutamate-1-semialdehyde 2,1-aminomutase
MFDGKYHGHGDATLVVLQDDHVVPEERGLPRWITGQARMIQFNDIAALHAALAPRDVALVLTEPALTNAGAILPDPRFHDELRRLTRASGTLLAIDETHTLVASYGGLTREWGLDPDFLTIGKSMAAGVPLGAYGMSDDLAGLIAPPDEHAVVSGVRIGEVATGGTLFANALSMAAGRAALEEVLTEDALELARNLGAAGGGRPRGRVRGGRPALERCPDVLPLLLRVLPAAAAKCDRVARPRRAGSAGADPHLHGEPGGVGIRLVARPHGVRRP